VFFFYSNTSLPHFLIGSEQLVLAALVAGTATGFVGPIPRRTSSFVSRQAAQLKAPEFDSIGNNIAVKNLLTSIEGSNLLSDVARSGLLSKAQAAGITLSSLEPLLEAAGKNPDILILVEASGPELLPILPKVVELAPSALPLLASVVSLGPGALQAGAFASAAAAALAVVAIPDDSTTLIALQTLIVATLGLAAPVALTVGASIFGSLTK
jgi:hypothetical protein